jgi:hypothetical protein
MAELSVSSDLPSFRAMPPPRPRSAPTEDTAPLSQAGWSYEALDDHQLRDAILMKTTLEGKDDRTAQREVPEERIEDEVRAQEPLSASATYRMSIWSSKPRVSETPLLREPPQRAAQSGPAGNRSLRAKPSG